MVSYTFVTLAELAIEELIVFLCTPHRKTIFFSQLSRKSYLKRRYFIKKKLKGLFRSDNHLKLAEYFLSWAFLRSSVKYERDKKLVLESNYHLL